MKSSPCTDSSSRRRGNDRDERSESRRRYSVKLEGPGVTANFYGDTSEGLAKHLREEVQHLKTQVCELEAKNANLEKKLAVFEGKQSEQKEAEAAKMRAQQENELLQKMMQCLSSTKQKLIPLEGSSASNPSIWKSTLSSVLSNIGIVTVCITKVFVFQCTVLDQCLAQEEGTVKKGE